jgi:hypothetical protein
MAIGRTREPAFCRDLACSKAPVSFAEGAYVL